jgi:hypothetical protein
MEKVRSMLNGIGIAQELWAEVVYTTYYMVNRSLSSMLVDSTPHELWFGKKPSLSHIRVFGCDSFVHVPKEKRNKMENKAVKCIFIGYKDGMKGCKLSDPVMRKTIYS